MVEDIKLGSPFTWTLQSPKESGKNVDEFYAFIDAQLYATGTGECHLHQHHQGKLPDADCRVSKVEQKKRLKEKMNNEIQFILYHLPDEEGKVLVVIKDETIWATQKAMAQLFGVGIPAISKHLTHIFDEGELDKEVVVSKMETTTQHGAIEGKTQKNETTFYSLDAIIAVGYRVSSARATKFRIWATRILNEYIRKGFVLDDERLKQGKAVFGKDYFRELLERVRSIRASERRIWQQITDIYAECSFDYDRNSPATREFYQMVQNRFHYAITGQTAPEIIYTRADHNKEHMGLQTWKNAQSKFIRHCKISD